MANLHIALQKGIWSTQSHNEGKLNEAYQVHDDLLFSFSKKNEVVLIFSVNSSGAFQGFARMASRIGYLEADVAYLRSDYLFLNDGDKKDAMFATICGLDREIEQLKSELASVNSQLSYY